LGGHITKLFYMSTPCGSSEVVGVAAKDVPGALVPAASGRSKLLMIVGITIAVLALVTVFVVFAFGDSPPPPPTYSDLRIASSNHFSNPSLGKEVFTVTVKNIGSASGTGTVVCYVDVPGWDEYSNSHDVQLSPGQETTFQVDVSMPTAAFSVSGTMTAVQIENEQTVQ
jgi:hypothetical protein